jgi:hypothetical protein
MLYTLVNPLFPLMIWCWCIHTRRCCLVYNIISSSNLYVPLSFSDRPLKWGGIGWKTSYSTQTLAVILLGCIVLHAIRTREFNRTTFAVLAAVRLLLAAQNFHL